MSLPSMEIRPAVDSMSLKSAKVRLLLPAPVRPPERYNFDYAMLWGFFSTSTCTDEAVVSNKEDMLQLFYYWERS